MAFVFRVALASAGDASAGADPGGVAQRLSGGASLVSEFLGPSTRGSKATSPGFPRPSRCAAAPSNTLLGDSEQRGELVREIQSWAESFEAPSFFRDQKSLV